MKHEADAGPEAADIQTLRAENARITALLQLRQQNDHLLARALEHDDASDRYLLDAALMTYARAELALLRERQP